MQTFSIPGNELRALLNVAAEADVRFYLCGIYATGNTLTATDGLGALRLPCSHGLDNIILGRPAKPLLKSTDTVDVYVHPSKNTVHWEEHSSTGKLLRRQTSPILDAVYPDLDNVLPDSWSETPRERETFAFDPELFARVSRHFSGTFRLRFPPEAGKPYRLDLSDAPDALCVAMPMRW